MILGPEFGGSGGDPRRDPVDSIPPPPGLPYYDDDPLLSAEQKGASPYTTYEICTSLEGNEGLGSGTLAQPRTPGLVGTVAWRVSDAATILRVTWVAERVGAQPVIPSPRIAGGMFELRGWRITPESPTPIMGADRYTFRVAGHYEYSMAVAADAAYLFVPIGASRHSRITTAEAELGPNSFSSEPLMFLQRLQGPSRTL